MASLNLQQGETFSIATLFYMRLRRVTSRVIDVMYFIENKQYALYIVDLAEKTNDLELLKQAEKLKTLLHLSSSDSTEEYVVDVSQPTFSESPLAIIEEEEKISDEDIYKAQVSHHYIGALR